VVAGGTSEPSPVLVWLEVVSLTGMMGVLDKSRWNAGSRGKKERMRGGRGLHIAVDLASGDDSH